MSKSFIPEGYKPVLNLYDTDGAAGAARGAGVGCVIYRNTDEAFEGLSRAQLIAALRRIEADGIDVDSYL